MIWDPTYIAYRAQAVDGRWSGPGNNREFRDGEIKVVKAAHKKHPRPAVLAGECDWIIPNFVHPYGEIPCRTSSPPSASSLTNSPTP